MATDTQKEYIVGLVVGMFNAAPGEAFLGEFENLIDAGVSFKQLADILEATPQFQNDILGGDNSVANQVAVLMDHFGLTPGNTDPASPDAQAEAFFNARLNEGATFGDIVIEGGLYLLENPAPEFAETAALFQNKILVARLYSEENSDDNVADLQAVLTDVTSDGPATEELAIAYLVAHGFIPPDGEPVDPGEPGETFTLTLNQDNLNGTVNNDTFNAPLAQAFTGNLVNTLQDADVLDGLEGTDTLNATVNGAAVVAPTLISIENVNLRSVENGSGIDFSNSTGVAKVTSANSTATTVIEGAGNIASFAVNNQTQKVTVTDSTATSINLSFNKFGSEAAAGVLDFNTGATSATVTIADSNVEVQTLASVKTLSVDATGENRLNAGTTESLTVSGKGSIEFADDLTALKTLTSTAEGGLTVTGLGAAFVTATTGAAGDSITIATATGVKNISTGAGDDTVSVTGALGATAVVDLGAGDDTLTLNTAPTKGVTLTGGEGTDTLQTTSTHYDEISKFSVENLAKINGFEVLGISNVLENGSITDVSKIAGIGSFVAAAGVATGGTANVTGLAADASVEIAGDQPGQTETATVTFANIGADETIVLAGATYTQGVDGDGTAADIAAFFSNGDSAEWTSGAVNGNDVTFTSKTANSNVADLANTGTGSVTNIAITQGAALASAGLLAIAMATDTATDVINLKLNNNYTENNDATSTITPLTHTVDASKVETLNVESTGTASEEFGGGAGTEADGVSNTLSLTNNDLVKLNVTGDQAFIFASAATMTKLATIDASANTAGVEIDASKAAATSPALTINGTGMADVITGGLKGDTITLGGGNDILDYTKGGASKIGTGAFDTITDFGANTFGDGENGAAGKGAAADATKWTGDVLKFSGDGGVDGAVVDVFTNASEATTFLAQNTNSTAGLVAALDSSTGNLYVDNTNDGVADFFIQLTGVTAIDAAAFHVVVV